MESDAFGYLWYTKVDRTSTLGAVIRRTPVEFGNPLNRNPFAGGSAENELWFVFLFKRLLGFQYIPR